MQKKKALSPRELETEKILQAALPEYIIRANMRLVDVIHAGRQFIYMRGYHLDFVICDEEANTIAAVELDDSTHNTKDGQRRDANKNRWMAQAKIKLIRIRTPEEALNIRELMEKQDNFNEIENNNLTIQKEKIYSFEKPHTSNNFWAFSIPIMAIVIISWGLSSPVKQQPKKIAAPTQITPQPPIISAEEFAKARAQQEAMQAAARQRIDATQPHYEQRVVKGKSVRECQIDGVITNASVLCMKDHYETVLVSGNQ